MSGFVLDCSVAAAWLFEDEATTFTESVLDAVSHGGRAAAPALWRLEIANVLLVAERRGRISQADSAQFAAALDGLPVTIDSRAPGPLGGAVLALGREHGLSAYDAAYLELALHLRTPMATLDKALIRAATATGVGLFDP